MNINIIVNKEQALLSRSEIKGTVDGFEVTPSNADVRKKIADKLKTKEENIAIQTIKGLFGKKSANFVAHIYKDEESKKKIELKAGKKAIEKAQKSASSKEAKKESKEENEGIKDIEPKVK